METLQGIAVAPGVAIGEALIVDSEGFRIPSRFVMRDVVEDEIARLDRAVLAVGEEMERNRETISVQLGEQCGAIFSAHLQILQDSKLRDAWHARIRERHNSPEYAVSSTLREYAKVFQSLDSGAHRALAADIFDIEKRLLHHLLGRSCEEITHLTSPVVLLAHDLTPSEAANLDRENVLGFAIEQGGPGGHIAIVAEALELPAVVGLGQFVLDVSGGDKVIIDGDHGQVILQPDEETLARYQHDLEEHHDLAKRLTALRDLPAETADGERIELLANIEFPHEVDSCHKHGAGGIGLYRTEFLYLSSAEIPDEESHFQVYAQVAQAMDELPVAIRTVDLGADKISTTESVGYGMEQVGRNPELGLRSIRLSLHNRELFHTQLRAILRASALGNVSIMFPLVSTLTELREAKSAVFQVMDELNRQGVDFCRDIPIGIMVESPAAVVMLDTFLSEVDFVSLGTNDLIQYCLAVDRTNKDVASLYDAGDPAVLRFIEMAARAAQVGSVPLTMCGQMCGNTTYTMLLLGLGFRTLSVAPSAIPELKKLCRSVSIEQCSELANRALQIDNARDVNELLKSELRQAVPDLAMFV